MNKKKVSRYGTKNIWHHLKDQSGFYKLSENEVLKVTYHCYRFCGSTVTKRHIEFLVAAM